MRTRTAEVVISGAGLAGAHKPAERRGLAGVHLLERARTIPTASATVVRRLLPSRGPAFPLERHAEPSYREGLHARGGSGRL